MDHLRYCASQPLPIRWIDSLVPCSVIIALYGWWCNQINLNPSPFRLQMFCLSCPKQVKYDLEAYRWLVFEVKSFALAPCSVAIIHYSHGPAPFWLRILC